MFVALRTDLRFPALDKGARISTEDGLRSLPPKSNAVLATERPTLLSQGILEEPFSEVDMLLPPHSHTPDAQINCQACLFF